MRKYAFTVILVAILIISSGTGCLSKNGEHNATTSMGQNSPQIESKFQTDTINHQKYGLSYPLTYEFSFPTGSSGLKAYKRYSSNDSWMQITEKTSNDFFNGIEAVRFDYSNNTVYVSTSYDPSSNNVFIKITDSSENYINTTFLQISKYYDNRSAVVLATMDDWGNGYEPSYADPYIQAFQVRNITISPAIITYHDGSSISNSKWNKINNDTIQGYVEPVSHSRNHINLPFEDYDSEINGSKWDILNNVKMPTVNTMGSQEYVYDWTEPYGESNATERAKLGQYGYLADRSTHKNSLAENVMSTWDYKNGLYNRHGVSVKLDDVNKQSWAQVFPGTDSLNSTFDSVMGIGGVYTIIFHPQATYLNNVTSHLDYVANRKNIWYVGIGQMYLYDFTHRMATSYIPITEKTYLLQI